MKSLIKLIVCAAALLPLARVQAGTNYYDLKPGVTYTLKVGTVVSTKSALTGATSEVAIPSGIPKFKKTQKVTFTIGSKGELKGPGFTIPLKKAAAGTSVYMVKPTGTNLPNSAAVKTINKKVTYTQLAFYKLSGSGFNTTTYQVVYLLQ